MIVGLSGFSFPQQSDSNPDAGTILSSYCLNTDGYDYNNTYWTGTWTAQIEYADGDGGSYSGIENNALGCWYPSGWISDSSGGDSTLSWTHGGDSGDFVFGYSYSTTTADGAGGFSTDSGGGITASDNQVVHTYESYDYSNNWAVNEVLHFDLDSLSFYEAAYPASGTLFGDGCVQMDWYDAANQFWPNLNTYYVEVADGWGGSATYHDNNTESCGWLPYGYWITYSSVDATIYYSDYNGIEQTFIYGEYTNGYYADGSGGSTESNNTSNNYESGYVFYSYYDFAAMQMVNYAFDGMDSYYTYNT